MKLDRLIEEQNKRKEGSKGYKKMGRIIIEKEIKKIKIKKIDLIENKI